MKRLVVLWYVLIMISLPLAVAILSGNVVLRLSATYVYHFNDSQVVDQVGSYVTGSQFADEISGYFNSIGSKEFQVYEENGEFRDPIFDEKESQVMARGRLIMNLTLALGVLLMGLAIGLYLFLVGKVPKIKLRRIGFGALGISAGLTLALVVAVGRKAVREMLYTSFIGIELGKGSTLKLLIGSPFEKTYIIFSTVLAVAMIGVLTYIHHSLTKEQRLFS